MCINETNYRPCRAKSGLEMEAVWSSPLLFPSLPSLPSVPSPPLPLEVGPTNPARGVSSAGGVWGGAPAEIEFGAF